jgi:hypothetical protein
MELFGNGNALNAIDHIQKAKLKNNRIVKKMLFFMYGAKITERKRQILKELHATINKTKSNPQKTTEDRKRYILEELCTTITKGQFNPRETIEVLIQFIYSLGMSIENIKEIDMEEILKQYASKPTIGNALVTMALFMKDTWLSLPQEDKGKNNE